MLSLQMKIKHVFTTVAKSCRMQVQQGFRGHLHVLVIRL